ncbi:108aa long hypothetical protein [Pyrococcus horikoshii OT3]|uniref:Uncharacterized protein n=1 Tax=Pyrococcus horikoshii (strain ATCC 700860 / DSM 12428 / JCM 9974 / NBRC 100139 / OT-3) TaxID=70601 RepID=O58896_PYRHO|nr:108aa long hypothetical protein [Pyrococcus horikoshii OT3]
MSLTPENIRTLRRSSALKSHFLINSKYAFLSSSSVMNTCLGWNFFDLSGFLRISAVLSSMISSYVRNVMKLLRALTYLSFLLTDSIALFISLRDANLKRPHNLSMQLI